MRALLFIFAIGILSCGSKQTPNPETSKEIETKHDGKIEQRSHGHHDNPHSEPKTGSTTAANEVLANDGTRKVGDVTTCPVTKDVFKISDTSPISTFEGKTYYFCCKGCTKDFDADPAKFLSGKSDTSEKHKHGDHAH